MKRFLASFLLVGFCSVLMFAQSNTGRLVGIVADSTGKVLPGAAVTLTDNKTGKVRTATTTDIGAYTFPQLEVGTYTLKITAEGFKTRTDTDIVIIVGQEYSLNVALEAGNISETVTVTAGQDIVNATNAELGQTVNSRQLTELPLNGRNPLNLILLQAGSSSNPNQGTSINGQRTSATNIIRDGINIQDNFIRSNATDFAPGRPSVDDVGEFTLTTQADASRGFGGPQVELVTPRGQNAFHGTLFEYNRNSQFAANNWFVNAGTNPAANQRPFRNRNQYGGNVSGPIIKEKLFFFAYYEKLSDRLFANALRTTLTDTAKQGIFRYTDASGVLQSVNIFSLPSTAFAAGNPAGNGIPLTINAGIVSRFISRLPGGNSADTGDQLNTTGYRFAERSNQDRDSFTTRIDYDINGRNSINGIYNRVKEGNLRSDVDTAFNVTPVVIQPSINNFGALAWRTIISSNFTNEVRGGVFWSKPDFLRTEANPSAFYGLPLVTNPEQAFQAQGRNVHTTNLQDNADLLWGNHSLRFGLQFQDIWIKSYNDASTIAAYTLGTNTNTPQILTSAFTNTTFFPGTVPSAQRGTANGLYSLLAGIVGAGSQSFNVTSQTSGFVPGASQVRIFKYQSWAPYVTDSWRATKSLTLSLGLRWDLTTPVNLKNQLSLEPTIMAGQSFDQSLLNPAGTFQFVGGNAGKAGNFYKMDKNNIAPVIGFAYAVNTENRFGRYLFGESGKTVFRGGWRMSYVNDETVRAPDNALLNNQGLLLASNALNASTGTASLNDRFGGTLTAIPTPTFVSSRTYALNNAAAALQGTVFGIDPDLKTPFNQEYSFGIQRDLGFNSVLEVRYVGSRSRNLTRVADINQVDIRGNGFGSDFNRARSNLLLCQATPGCTTGGAYNAGVPGSAVLTVFPNLAAGGLLTNSTITNSLIAGTPADLAVTYLINGLQGTVPFVANPNAFVVDKLYNGATYDYNSLQVEFRRRFAHGLMMQANYTFSKNLTNAQGTSQTRVEPLLDNQQPFLERSRADFDQTHVFNTNAIYELPFGKGKAWLNHSGPVDWILGGWQTNTIIRWGSGSPITFTDARGTLNRAGRSGRQTAVTSLSKDALKALMGVFKTPNGVYFINPSALGRNPDGTLQAGRTGRGADGFGSAAFAGQAFFNNAPGTTSSMERAILDGPNTFNIDLSLFKNFRIREGMNLQIRGEFFNLINNANFIPAQFLDINSTSFGRITASSSARVVQFAARFNF